MRLRRVKDALEIVENSKYIGAPIITSIMIYKIAPNLVNSLNGK